MDEQPTVQQTQPVASAPQYQNPETCSAASPLSMGSYVGMLVLSLIPIVNLIMFLVWGFGSPNLNRRNYGRAALIVLAIVVFLEIVALVSGVNSLHGNFPGYRT